MSTNNLDLFSYLPGLEVTENEILEAELSAQQILKAKYPDIDLRQGTALRDLLIRPSATLLALVNKALVFYFQQNDISSITDTTSQAFVDKMLSNWFLTRKLGVNAIISARLYFSKAKSVNLYSDLFFSTDGKLKFTPITSLSFSPDQLTFDSSANQFYLDVDLQAEQAGTDYNITAGSLLYFSNFDPYFLHAEINYLRQSAQNIETNTQFLGRAKSAISTRNLINVPSIAANLTDYFTDLSEVKSVGFGDLEMTRDQIKVLVPGVTDPIWIHNGGMVDVYARVPLASSIVQLVTDSNGEVNITGSIYKVERSLVSGGALDDTMAQQVTKSVTSITSSGTLATVTAPTPHGYSTGQLVTISGASPVAYNGTFSVTVTSSTVFTYVLPGTATSPATGTILSGIPLTFTVTNANLLTVAPTAITRVGLVVSVNYANHGLMVGDRVKISGAGQTDYNGIFVVGSVTNKDIFTYTLATGLAPVTPATGTLVLKYVDRYNDVGFSERQTLTASFGSTYANKTVSFILYFHQNIDGIQAYLSDSNRRVICADMLAKGFNLTLLDVTIKAYNGPSPDAALANSTTISYLETLSAGQPFVMSDLLSRLYTAGIQTIQTPITITYTKYWNDMLGATSGTIVDTLNPNDTTNIFMVNTMTTGNLTLV